MSAFRNSKFCVFAAGVTLLVLSGAAIPASAQDQPQQQQQRLSDQELQQLVAPIALYPDPLLAQILTASTYPLEVVMAARWSKDNPDLKGQDLENAMQQQPWDPSVKGLAAVPQVLAMMNDKLDWTQQLGEAFLAQPDDITKAAQTLRAKAEATGNLKTTKEQRVRRVAAPPPSAGEVVVVPEYIAIEPVEPDVIYVPIYDPVVIFGVGYWPAAYVPFFWYPPWWTVGPVWGFWPAYYVGPALWCQYNWGFGFVQINVVQFNRFNRTHLVSAAAITKWQHDPKHHGAPYKTKSLNQTYGKASTQGGGPKGSKSTGLTTTGGGTGGGSKGSKGSKGTAGLTTSTGGGGGSKGSKDHKGSKGTTSLTTSTGGGGGSKGSKDHKGSKGTTSLTTSTGGGGGSKGPRSYKGTSYTSTGGGFKGAGPKGGGGGGATSFRSMGGGGGGGGGGSKGGGGGGGGGAPRGHKP